MPDKDENTLRINARGLSGHGPRLMVQSALASASQTVLRVVVSNQEAADDVMQYLESLGGTTEMDHIGNEFYVYATMAPSGAGDESSS